MRLLERNGISAMPDAEEVVYPASPENREPRRESVNKKETSIMKMKSITDGQIKQILGFARSVLENVGLRNNQVMNFIASSARIKKFKEDFEKLLGSTFQINPYTKEWVKQTYFYPRNWQAKDVTEQVIKLVVLFPGIDLSQVKVLVAKLVVQKLADGIAVLPKLSFLGELWNIADPYGDGYGRICEKLFGLIAADDNRTFYNHQAGKMYAKYIRIMEEVRLQLTTLEANTSGDVIVLHFSFGNLYAGWSPRAARWEAVNNDQLPLITAQVACLLLTMPDRLTTEGQLYIDCSGDEWNWGADGYWAHSPYFLFHDDSLKFYVWYSDGARGSCGSAVAFLGSVAA